MPRTRRNSTSSVGSIGSATRPLKISRSNRRCSVRGTYMHTTQEDKEKKTTASRRKSTATRHQSMKKETKEEKPVLSPMPYWRVARERGVMSPRETRSIKKNKNETNDKENSDRPGLLCFSPPNQAENLRREKEEIERKESNRKSRVRKAREGGQLLIFSPTFRNPAPLPPEAADTKSGKRRKHNPEISEESPKDKGMNIAENVSSPTDMEVQIRPDMESSNVSAPTFTQTMMNNPDVATELQRLNETVSQLKSESQNANIEARLQRFELEFKSQESKSANEREQLIVENTKLKASLEASTREVDSKIKTLEGLNSRLESQCEDLKNEKANLLDQTTQFKTDLADAQRSLSSSKNMVEELKRQQNEEVEMMSDEASQLKQMNSNLGLEVTRLKAQNQGLASVIENCEEKIDHLENRVMPLIEAQLKETQAELDRFKTNEPKIESQIREYEKALQELKAELGDARQEKEEERQNLEALKKDSCDAYSKMSSSLDERNQQIENMQSRIRELEASLVKENKKILTAGEEMASLKSSMQSRVQELEESVRSSVSDLKQVTAKKEDFEKQLKNALAQIQEDAAQKEQFATTIQNRSTEMKVMHGRSESMQRRIDALEEHLQLAKQERDDARMRLETSDDREQDLYEKLHECHRVRRELHNRVMQLSGNIRVFVRVRPTLPGEQDKPLKTATPSNRTGKPRQKLATVEPEPLFKFPGMGSSDSGGSQYGADDPTKNLLEVTEPKKDRGGLSERQKKWKFGFDNVFNQSHNQEDIWVASKPLIQSAIDGFNVTLFAYGQTGSGKTFTMLGEEGNEGIITRAVQKLFDSKREIEDLSRDGSKVELFIELLEVYNEKVRDLLVPNKNFEGQELNLKVTANEAVGSVRQPVSTEEEVFKILSKAQKRRCVKATASNAVSSRSHMLFTIHFKVESKSGVRSGKLNICDLAGSERLGKSEANANVGSSLLKETKHINTSLSVLSNVIEKLQGGDASVPYRESKLTYLLQNSLGGNSKTLAIICCSPLQSHFHETLCSLRFAAKVNRVDLKAKANFSC